MRREGRIYNAVGGAGGGLAGGDARDRSLVYGAASDRGHPGHVRRGRPREVGCGKNEVGCGRGACVAVEGWRQGDGVMRGGLLRMVAEQPVEDAGDAQVR